MEVAAFDSAAILWPSAFRFTHAGDPGYGAFFEPRRTTETTTFGKRKETLFAGKARLSRRNEAKTVG
jgi:hypothetical protein